MWSEYWKQWFCKKTFVTSWGIGYSIFRWLESYVDENFYFHRKIISETSSKPNPISKMKIFVKIVNGFQSLIIFAKNFILKVFKRSLYFLVRWEVAWRNLGPYFFLLWRLGLLEVVNRQPLLCYSSVFLFRRSTWYSRRWWQCFRSCEGDG